MTNSKKSKWRFKSFLIGLALFVSCGVGYYFSPQDWLLALLGLGALLIAIPLVFSGRGTGIDDVTGVKENFKIHQDHTTSHIFATQIGEEKADAGARMTTQKDQDTVVTEEIPSETSDEKESPDDEEKGRKATPTAAT